MDVGKYQLLQFPMCHSPDRFVGLLSSFLFLKVLTYALSWSHFTFVYYLD